MNKICIISNREYMKHRNYLSNKVLTIIINLNRIQKSKFFEGKSRYYQYPKRVGLVRAYEKDNIERHSGDAYLKYKVG